MMLKKLLIILLKKFEIGSAIAVRLTKLTGKANDPIHPKHFLTQKPWFIKYIKKEFIVLDLGCGNGQNTIKAAKFAKKIYGMDKDNTQLKIAKNLSSLKKIKNAEFLEGDLEKRLEFKNNQFNCVLMLDILEHLNKRNQFLKGVHRILTPNGLLFVSVPNKDTSWKILQKKVNINFFSDPDHKLEYSEKEIKKVLVKHKFKIIQFNYGKYDTPFRGLIDIIGGFSLSIYKKITDWRQKRADENPKEASGFEIVAIKS